ncbi:hypothetical protein [Modestobacter sp. NPDC049651]|uniref:hypothetical protein n=1 Tax=unclassified Modestobacter TaxID=2643866 RepID=UPI0033D99DF8
MSGSAGRWLAAAGLLAAASLGLAWAPGAPGLTQPSRVLVVAVLALVVLVRRTGRTALLPAAAAVAVLGAVLGGFAASPGRLALAAAAVCLLGAVRAGTAPGEHAARR